MLQKNLVYYFIIEGNYILSQKIYIRTYLCMYEEMYTFREQINENK